MIAVTGVSAVGWGPGRVGFVVGLPILTGSRWYAARGFAHLERLRLRSMMGRPAPRPSYVEAGPDAGGSARRVLTPLRDPGLRGST